MLKMPLLQAPTCVRDLSTRTVRAIRPGRHAASTVVGLLTNVVVSRFEGKRSNQCARGNSPAS